MEHRVNSRLCGKNSSIKVTAISLKELLEVAFLHIIGIPVKNVIGVVHSSYERLEALWFPGNEGLPGMTAFKRIAEYLTDKTCECAIIDASGILVMLFDEDYALRALL